MSARRAADRRIRAASMAVPGLYVRGPVSQALARAGVEVPPVGATEEEAAVGNEATPSATPVLPKRRAEAAPRVLKPFADEPWPSARAPKAAPRTLSGLTADERRVHRILLETLAMQNDQGYGQGVVGLSYAEKQKLTVLDLNFIDAEIAKMERGADWSSPGVRWLGGLGGGALGAAAAVLAVVGAGDAAIAMGVAAILFTVVFGLLALVGGPTFSQADTPRHKIYNALRELALLADPDAVTSDALAQADAVIDRLAASDVPAPRLTLDDETPSVAPQRGPRRVRS